MASARKIPVFWLDSFTDSKFSGNPAAVCLVAGNLPKLADDEMLKIAAEIKATATGFVFSDGDADSFQKDCVFGLRWFAPKQELTLCGHATLASGAVLFHVLGNASKTIGFDTPGGRLTVARDNRLVSVDFPLPDIKPQDRQEIDNLLDAVVQSSLIQDVQYSSSTKKLLVRLQDGVSREELECLKPQTSRMLESHNSGEVQGVIVTVKGSETSGVVDPQGRPYDFMSRYFAPWLGIDEDPATGSAHTVLASYWSRELKKTELYARQCSARGGTLRIRVDKDRVHVSGEAVIIMKGTLEV